MATDLEQAERITHCIKMSANEVKKFQVSGFYRDIPVVSGQVDVTADVQSKVNELEGVSQTNQGEDDEHLILEMHVNADVPGFEDTSGIKLPYIITIDKFDNDSL